MRDGIVYGGLVGLGFNWFEAALYVGQGYAEYGVAPYGAELGARYALFGFGGHALFTALFGAFLGLGLQTPRIWLRYLAPPTGLLLAVAAHVLNNALPLFLALAGAAAGEPPPTHEPLPDVSFLQAFWGGTLLHLTLARRNLLRIYGGVRFGGTLTMDDAWEWGFDHVAIAAGAGPRSRRSASTDA